MFNADWSIAIFLKINLVKIVKFQEIARLKREKHNKQVNLAKRKKTQTHTFTQTTIFPKNSNQITEVGFHFVCCVFVLFQTNKFFLWFSISLVYCLALHSNHYWLFLFVCFTYMATTAWSIYIEWRVVRNVFFLSLWLNMKHIFVPHIHTFLPIFQYIATAHQFSLH